VFFDAPDEFGTIREGLAADLVLVAANPLEDFAALARPDGVMVRGRWLDRAVLDAGLAEIAARYRE
jgi:imidazolonepropionase-like amidohydrolase